MAKTMMRRNRERLTMTRHWVTLVTALTAACPGMASSDTWSPPPFDPLKIEATGYRLVFESQFEDLSQIDFAISANGKPGAKFYARIFDKWGGVPASARQEDVSVSAGVLTIAGGQIATIAPAPDTTDGFVGTTFRGGGYFEARLAWDRGKVHADFSKPIDNRTNWWPSFYSVPVEYFTGRMQWPGQPSGYVHFVENDFFEAWSGNYYGATIHDWYGPLHCYGESTPLDYCHISNDGASSAHPTEPALDGVAKDQNKVHMGGREPDGFHVIGALWVSARHAPDGIGYVEYFFDGKSTGVWKSWKRSADRSIAPPTRDAVFAGLDDDRSVIFVGAPRNSPLKVDWIRVWQLPTEESNVAVHRPVAD